MFKPPNPMKTTIQLLTSLTCIALCCASAHAAIKYWDIDGATPGAGGATPSGTWSTGAANWSTDSTGSSATAAWSGTTDTAIFSAGSDATGEFTVNLPSAITAVAVTNEEGIVNLTGAALTAQTITIGSGATLSYVSSGAIVAGGGGATTNMTINGGAFRCMNPGVGSTFLPTAMKIVLGTGGGTLSVDGAASAISIYSGLLTGTGPFTKAGQGIFRLAGTVANYSGATIISGGTLQISTVANVLPAATDLTINSGGTLNVQNTLTVGSLAGAGNVTISTVTLTVGGTTSPAAFAGVISDYLSTSFGRITKSGAGTLTLSGVNTYRGTFTLSAGTCTVTSGASLCGAVCDVVVNGGTLNLNNAAQTIENLSGTAGTINLASGHTLTSAAAGSTTYSGVIAGLGSLDFTGGASTLTLAGANTYSGATTVSSGRFRGATGGSCANTTITVASGATNGVSVTDNTKQWTCSAVSCNSGAALDFDYGYTIAPSTTVAPLVVSGVVDFTSTPNVSIRGGNFPAGAAKYPLMTWGSVIGTPPTTAALPPHVRGTLIVEGNTLKLDVTSTGVEPLTWATNSQPWEMSSTTSSNWLDAASAPVSYEEAIPPGDQVVFEDTKSVGDPIVVTLDTVVSPSKVTVNSAKTYTISGTGGIAGTTSLSKQGTGRLTLVCANTYSGGTTNGAGSTLQLGDGTANGSVAGSISNGGTLVFSNAAAQTYSGAISGTGRLIKGATGTLTLSGGNSFSGGATVQEGTLWLSSTANNMTGPVLVTNGAKLELTSQGCIGSIAGGSGDITLDNGATLQNDEATVGGEFVTPNRKISIGSGGGTLNLPNSAAILFRHDAGILAGVTPGVGTLTKDGAGELRTYNVHNTFGKLVVNGGIFTVGQASTAGFADSYGQVPGATTADAITLQNGGQIRQNVASLSLDAKQGMTVGSGGGTIRAVSGLTFTIPGVITGSDGLQLNSSADGGAIALSGANTCSGGVSLFRGTLYINNAQALGSSASTFTINSSGTSTTTIGNTSGGPITLLNNNPQNWNGNFVFSGTSDLNLGAGAVTLNATVTITNTSANRLTVGGSISGGFGLAKAGTGPVSLTAANAYNGGTTVIAGTLDIQHDGGLSGGDVTVASGAILKLGSGAANTYIDSAATLTLNGASPSVNLAYTGTPNTINALYFGANQMPAGTWGAPGSGATFQSAFFIGTGKLLISTGGAVVASQPSQILSVTNTAGANFDLTLKGMPAAAYVLVSSPDAAAPLNTWTPVAGSTTNAPHPSGQWTFTVNAPAPQFYRLMTVP
jgi:fibronectin-binding autotransporter adhesin